LCHEVSTREEHTADCPHWSEHDNTLSRVAELEAAITRAIEMFSGDEGGPVEGIDWSGEIGLLRSALEKK
jgi:hypothetical protein